MLQFWCFKCCSADTGDISPHTSSDDGNGDHDSLEKKSSRSKNIAYEKCDVKPPRLQSGVLRTNCIDCLDRTNVAQYAYGWAALGQQLHVLGIRDVPAIELDDPLAISLMGLYERMGDTLAHQYGGSAAHNKVMLSYFTLKFTETSIWFVLFILHSLITNLPLEKMNDMVLNFVIWLCSIYIE